MKTGKKFWILGGFLLFLVGQASAQENWKTIQDKDGIVVESREVAGYSTNQVRSKGIVKAPLTRILGLFQDMEHKSEWQPGTTERILETVGDREMFTYRRVASSIASDRDVILHVQVRPEVNEKAVYLTFESVASTPSLEKNQPEVPGVVRMPFVRGQWKLKPIEQGQWTEVEYEIHLSLGGSISNWIANRVIKKMPFDTLSTLQKQAPIHQYKEFERNLEQHPDYKVILAP